jgi:hypothetical protein
MCPHHDPATVKSLAVTSLCVESAVHRLAIGCVYRKLPGSILLSVTATWEITVVLWQGSDITGLLAWAVTLAVVNIGRFSYALRRIRSADFLDDPEGEGRMMSLGLLVAGAGFAIGYACFAIPAPSVEQYASTAINVGFCAGAAIMLSGCRVAFFAFMVPFIGVVTGTMLWRAVACCGWGRFSKGRSRRHVGVVCVWCADVSDAGGEFFALQHGLRFEKGELLRAQGRFAR